MKDETQAYLIIGLFILGIIAVAFQSGKESGMIEAGCECIEWDRDYDTWSDTESVSCAEWRC